MTTPLDANALIALCWPKHEHHEPMLEWFARHARQGLVTFDGGVAQLLATPEARKQHGRVKS